MPELTLPGLIAIPLILALLVWVMYSRWRGHPDTYPPRSTAIPDRQDAAIADLDVSDSDTASASCNTQTPVSQPPPEVLQDLRTQLATRDSVIRLSLIHI